MQNAWITNTGVVKYCTSHDEFAWEYLQENLTVEEYDERVDSHEYGYQHLHNMGWVRVKFSYGKMRVMGDCMDLTKPMTNTMDPVMNNAQMRTVKRWLEELGQEFSDEIFND